MRELEVVDGLGADREWLRQKPRSGDWLPVDEPTLVRDAEGGVCAIYEAFDVAPTERAALRSVKPYLGNRTGGMRVRAKTFGARPRLLLQRWEYCGEFALNRERPEVAEALVALGARVAARFRELLPKQHDAQVAQIEAEIAPEYRMVGPFTSGIANYDSALTYHHDGGNYAGSWNAMLTLREHTTGGELVVPSLGIALACADATLSIFDAQARVHGVTPIVRQRRDGYRISVVYFALRALRDCLPCDEELDRARRKRTEREERRAGLRT